MKDIDNITKKLYFEINSPYFTYLFQYFTGKAIVAKSEMGTSIGRLWDLVVRSSWDQIIGRPRDV